MTAQNPVNIIMADQNPVNAIVADQTTANTIVANQTPVKTIKAEKIFELEVYDNVRVYAKDLERVELTLWPPFQHWISTLTRSLSLQSEPSHPFHQDPYKLREVTIESYSRFGNKLGFIKLFADVSTAGPEETKSRLPGVVFLRGPAVAMLVVLIPDDVLFSEDGVTLSEDHVRLGKNGKPLPRDARYSNDGAAPTVGVPLSKTGPYNLDEAYMLLTVQPRIPTGSLSFVELPAGMLDGTQNFAGAAAREIEEELGILIKEDELTCLTDRVGDIRRELYPGPPPDPARTESIPFAMYPSAGGCDEYIKIFSHERRVPRGDLYALQGKLTGLRDEGEMITLKIVRLADLWLEGAMDSKALAAVALYSKVKQWEEQQAMSRMHVRTRVEHEDQTREQ